LRRASSLYRFGVIFSAYVASPGFRSGRCTFKPLLPRDHLNGPGTPSNSTWPISWGSSRRGLRKDGIVTGLIIQVLHVAQQFLEMEVSTCQKIRWPHIPLKSSVKVKKKNY